MSSTDPESSRRPSSPSISSNAAVERAVADDLGDVVRLDVLVALQVGDRGPRAGPASPAYRGRPISLMSPDQLGRVGRPLVSRRPPPYAGLDPADQASVDPVCSRE